MKGRNNRKIMKLFEYFKQAFNLNKMNRQLYKPQIIFLVLRGLLLFLLGLSMAELSRTMMPFIGGVSVLKFMSLLWKEFQGTPLLLTLVTMLVLIFGSTYVEAGLYALYAKVNRGDRDNLVFATGANRYFLSFLGGNILIFLFWVIASIPYVIVGSVTLTLGFVWVPIIISALLMVWKASVVSDDVGVFTAIGNSINFGKSHFWPAAVFIIVRKAILAGSSSGGGSSGGSNWTNSFNNFDTGGEFDTLPFDGGFGTGPNFRAFPEIGDVGNLVYWITTGLFTLIAIVSIVSGLIQMLFEIFFGLTTVIIYQDDWYLEPLEDEEQLDEAETLSEIESDNEEINETKVDVEDTDDPNEEVEG